MTIKKTSAKKTMLCLGENGQLARSIKFTQPEKFELVQINRQSLSVDNTLYDRLDQLVAQTQPSCILNATAYTNVEQAEAQSKTFEINHALVDIIGQVAQKNAIPLIHISTDYVFSGDNEKGYKPSDTTGPINAYGRSKLAGEHALLNTALYGAIVRTSWLYSPWGHNFVITMLKRFQSGTARVVADQYASPTSALGLAKAIWIMAQYQILKPTQMQILHWTDCGQASWYNFAKVIAHKALTHGLLEYQPSIIAVNSAEFPTIAKRPKNSVLLPSALFDEIGVNRLSWENALNECLFIMARTKRYESQEETF